MRSVPEICVLCAASRPSGPLATHEDNGTIYELYACHACDGQFWWPFKNPGARWYEHDERYGDRNQDPILKPNEKHTHTIAYLDPKVGRVLDVGCGVGNFLAHAARHGWETWGIDFDRDAIEAGKQTFGLEHLYVTDLGAFAAAHPGVKFDLVTFFDVLEHLDNHTAFFADIRRVLAGGGRIALSMPYRHGWRWLMPHDLPPRHLTRWDETSLTRILEREGFAVEEIKRLPASFTYLVMKMRFRYGRWASFGMVRAAKERSLEGKEGKEKNTARKSFRLRFLQTLARTKDIILFGIPAGILWLALLLTRKRYTDFMAIARLR